MSTLVSRSRPPAGEPEGLLVLHHGRGTDERDLLGLADALDPHRRLYVVTPRAPLTLQGAPGYHWYVVPRVGHPEPQTFAVAYRSLADLHDELWESTGLTPAKTVLGGFSMGAVMSYALGLGGDRPRPAGILAFSGFIPTVAGWEPDLAARSGLRAFISHGERDPVIGVDFARTAERRLREAGLEVSYHESPQAAHNIDPRHIELASDWIAHTIAPSA